MDRTLNDVLIEELQDIYSAKTQLVKLFPKVSKKVCTDELREVIDAHLTENENHIKLLEDIAEMLGCKLTGKKCKAMEGIVEECTEGLEESDGTPVSDVKIASNQQRIENYEIASVGTAKAIAMELGLDDAISLLEEILDEDKVADEKITDVCQEYIFTSIAQEEGDSKKKKTSGDGKKKNSKSEASPSTN